MINGIASMGKECVKQINRLNCTTHNIANVNTPGFKAERMFFLEGDALPVNQGGGFMKKPLFIIDYSPGTFQKTGNVMDMAIKGEGFFAIETAQGTSYSRDGRFTINENKELVTQGGDYVLGRSGRIAISGKDVQIGKDGAVTTGGGKVDTLRIVEFENPALLENLGKGLFRDSESSAGLKIAQEPEVCSGYLELSNVSAVQEMADMINIHRSFETYQKTMQTLQEQDELSTNRIGRLA